MKLKRENRSTLGKTCPSAILSTTNLTWNDPESNPGLSGERPGTNRLSHGTANPYKSYLDFSRVQQSYDLGCSHIMCVFKQAG